MKNISKKVFFIVSIVFTCIGCSKIKPEDLLVINNIRLGTSKKDFYKQLDSLDIKHDKFLRQIIYIDYNSIYNDISSAFDFPVTYTFTNLDRQTRENLGIISPITRSGTDNVVGLIVLLGHTNKPYLFKEAFEYKDLITIKYFKQSINERLVEQIRSLYTTKYGVPKIDTLIHCSYYYKTLNKVSRQDDIDEPGVILNWETKALKIKYFLGYTKGGGGGYYLDEYQRYMDIENSNEQNIKIPCLFYPYIEYSLKENVVEDLKLDKPVL